MDSSEYLYLILVPVAQVFRKELPEGKAPFSALKKGNKCRVKFLNEKHDKGWRSFCDRHDLKNDESLEY